MKKMIFFNLTLTCLLALSLYQANAANKYNCPNQVCTPPSNALGTKLPGSPGDTGHPKLSHEEFFRDLVDDPFSGVTLDPLTIGWFLHQIGNPERDTINLPHGVAVNFNKLPVIVAGEETNEYGFRTFNNNNSFETLMPIIKGEAFGVNPLLTHRGAVNYPNSGENREQYEIGVEASNYWWNQKGAIDAHTHPSFPLEGDEETLVYTVAFSSSDVAGFLADKSLRVSLLKTDQGNVMITRNNDAEISTGDYSTFRLFDNAREQEMHTRRFIREAFKSGRISADRASRRIFTNSINHVMRLGDRFNFDVWFAPPGSTEFKRLR